MEFYGDGCVLHSLEHYLFVLIKLKIRSCLFALVEGSLSHSCLKSELLLPSNTRFSVTACTGKGRTGNYSASSKAPVGITYRNKSTPSAGSICGLRQTQD